MIKYLLILFSIPSYMFTTQEIYSEMEYKESPNIARIHYDQDTWDSDMEYHEYDNIEDSYYSYPEETYNSPTMEVTKDDFYDRILQDYYESESIPKTTTNIYTKVKQDYYNNSNISHIISNIYDQLPQKEQDHIRLTILEYELEKQKNQLYFLPAINNVLAQKKLLSCTLTNMITQPLTSESEQIRIKSLIKVILEKEIMVSNLIISKESIDKKLYQKLKEQIAIIINKWLYNELIKNPNTRSELIKTLNVIFDVNN